ncbi:MAG: TIGR03619 family F420-dependent LLM class oxidoreductase [Nocardioides sp.]|nr:TIGR03619 family F420-dependent LLM class oxidoreductase [Nocardioides sp.]
MRIGIVSPVVTRLPGVAGDWEASAGIGELARVAQAADRLGFDHVTCSEHVGVPVDVAEQRGGTYWDPLATLGHLSALTSRIRLATQVLVLGYHHPLEIVKRYGTLDEVSGGRVVLGLGVGSLEEEFALLEVPFAGRGERADDALAALRAAWGRRVPSYAGSHHAFDGFVVEPHGVRTDVPLWIGGRTRRSLRRAVELGTGWVPFGLPLDDLAAMLDGSDLPADFEVVLSPGRPLDPLADADRTRARLERTIAAGATLLSVTVRADSVDHYEDQLAALAELVDLEPPATGGAA